MNEHATVNDAKPVSGATQSELRSVLTEVQERLKKSPSDTKLLRSAAAAHRQLGETAQAQQAEITAIHHSSAVPVLAKAAQLMTAKEFGEASRILAEYLQQEPDDLAALTLSAEAGIALGVAYKVLPMLEKVLGRAPGFLRARILYSNGLMLTDRVTDALRVIGPVAEKRPDDAEIINLLSRIHTERGDYASACKANEDLVRLDPNSPEALTNLGDSLRFGGKRAEAISAYRNAIAKDPCHGRAWWSLADLDASALTSDDITQVNRALEQRRDQPEHAGNLHFALGIAYDVKAEPEQAFNEFAAGNRLRRQAQPYNAQDITSQVDRYLEALGEQPGTPKHAPSDPEPIPIFVLGMPRAGSTLVERMLGRHSAVEALGELSIVPHMVDRLRTDAGEDKLELTIANLGEATLANMGQWYVARAKERMNTNARFFVDKLHMNWRHLPLILRMLPQARIIDIRRNAMDCCWSNFKTLFARGHPAASDLTDIGLFYRDYARQTDTLRQRFPGRIHLQGYEALVESAEDQIRSLLAATDITFEPQMLEFHLSEDPVATASSEQVRKPLNRKGIGAWRAYEPWLAPLRAALGELADV
ncbi:putative beta-barrel assembly-enhancing protease [Altererythrobacter insulae]|nr:putative beta-barrel assembly-enhancing protease [Altererythrobacter insulae]